MHLVHLVGVPAGLASNDGNRGWWGLFPAYLQERVEVEEFVVQRAVIGGYRCQRRACGGIFERANPEEVRSQGDRRVIR